MSIRKLYPYHVPFKRTGDWWSSGGTWYQISTWLRASIRHRWEYMDEKFMFETEQDKAWFMLRWM